MGVREQFAGLGAMPGGSSQRPQQPEYIIVGYGPDGDPLVRPGPGVSDLTSALAISEFGTKPIPLSKFKQFLEQSKTHAFNRAMSPIVNSPAGAVAGMLLGGRAPGGGIPSGRGVGQQVSSPIPGTATSGGRGIPGTGFGVAEMPAGGPLATTGPRALGPARTPPSPTGARLIPEARLPAPPEVPTYTPEVVPGPTGLRAFSGRVTNMPPRSTPAAGQVPMSGPAPAPALPSANLPPTARSFRDPGGLDIGQVSQMDAAASGLASGFTNAPLVPRWAKGVGGAAAALGGAYLAGRSSGSKQANAPTMPWNPSDLGVPMVDALNRLRSYAQQPGDQPAATQPPQGVTPPTGPTRGPARPVGGYKIAGGVSTGGGQQQMQAGQGGASVGSAPKAQAANYYSDMLGAADSGDAYARDLVNLTAQARQVAYKAQQEGKHLQFVPLHDMRNNRLYLVNANGQDVVLDLNDENDKAAFGRMTAKIGVDPASIMAWAQGSSRPLHRYMVPPGSQGDWAPQFNQPGTAPQTGAAEEPQASPAPFELPQVPAFTPGGALPTMRGLNVTADRPTDARFAEIQALREQGLGGSQLDEMERKLREMRTNNPGAYARGLGG